MKVQTYYPENPILKTHIEYYYFLKNKSKDFSERYCSFPHINHSFNIHKNVTCEIGSDYTFVREHNNNGHLAIIQGKYETPLSVHLKGRMDKITIIFKPLGFNHFIDKPFACVASQPSQIFTEWQNDSDYLTLLNDFYGTEDNARRVQFLELFLLSKYRELKDYSILKKAIAQLTDFKNEYSIEEITNNIGMNIRSFNRLFRDQLGISPSGFKKIARFRHSLENKLSNKQFKKLTEIGYESNFYDQSYFIKMYKKLTEDAPTTFFQSIEKLADDQLIFKFINEK